MDLYGDLKENFIYLVTSRFVITRFERTFKKCFRALLR